MTEKIIIDVNECPHKRDDECMEVPICNEYGDLMGYQSCEAQTLCPYRSQKKIEHLEQENEKLKKEVKQIGSDFIKKGDYARELEQENKILREKFIILSEKRGNLVVNNNTLKEQITKLKERNLNIRRHKNLLLESNDKLMRENSKYRIALEEIRKMVTAPYPGEPKDVLNIINEVLK